MKKIVKPKEQALQSNKTVVLSDIFQKHNTFANQQEIESLLYQSKDLKLQVQGHTGCITALAISVENNRLYSASDDKSIKIWSLSSFTLEKTLKCKNWINSLVIYDNRLFAGGADKCITIYDINSSSSLIEMNKLIGHTDYINILIISNHKLYSASSDGSIIIWNLKTLTKQSYLKNAEVGAIYALTISNDAHRIFCAGFNKIIKVYDETYFEHYTSSISSSSCSGSSSNNNSSSSCSSSNNSSSSSSSSNNSSDISNSSSGSSSNNSSNNSSSNNSSSSSSNNNSSSSSSSHIQKSIDAMISNPVDTIANNNSSSSSSSSTIVPIATLTGHTHWIKALLCTDTHLFSGSYDYTIKIWSLTSYQELATLVGHTGYVHTLILSPSVYKSSSFSHSVINNTVDNTVDSAVDSNHRNASDETDIDTNSDNELLLYSGSWDKTVKVWNIKHYCHDKFTASSSSSSSSIAPASSSSSSSSSIVESQKPSISTTSVAEPVTVATFTGYTDFIHSLVLFNSTVSILPPPHNHSSSSSSDSSSSSSSSDSNNHNNSNSNYSSMSNTEEILIAGSGDSLYIRNTRHSQLDR